MVRISIACLIYKSTRWLQFVYDQVRRHTDLVALDAEFYFVANDACPAVLEYLQTHQIPHYVHENTPLQRQEWYINNVYRAWNTACRRARGEYVVLINSDMAFTPGWLDRLMAHDAPGRMVTSRLVERGILQSGQYGIECNFGNVPTDYQETAFLNYARSIVPVSPAPVLYPGGLYMPMWIRREDLERVGYYPEGNPLRGSNMDQPVYATREQAGQCISGDRVLVEKLRRIGVEHWTAFDSVVYHFQEGEMRD